MSAWNREKSSKENRIEQKQFLFIKERLDHYMFPTQFPLEVAPLLLKMIKKLD